jgi:hypothetical protein
MSWPTPFTVLQPASVPNMLHKNSVAINDAKILLAMMYLLSRQNSVRLKNDATREIRRVMTLFIHSTSLPDPDCTLSPAMIVPSNNNPFMLDT